MPQSCLLLKGLQERKDQGEQKVIKRTWEESNLQNMRFSHGGQEVLFLLSFDPNRQVTQRTVGFVNISGL
jgi:hypothetical protein